MSRSGLYVLVKVLSVYRNYAYPCCIRCSRRLRNEDDENTFSCSECRQRYDKREISYRYRVNMTVSDRTQVSNVTIFGQCLETFFGTSATHFKRFIDSLDYEDLSLPVDEIVHQCMEQCFVGSVVKLCFSGLHPSLPDSQVTRSSPTYLKNIQTKIFEPERIYLPKLVKNSSHLLASYISRPEDTEITATVIQLLKEYLEFFRYSKNLTTFHSCTIEKASSISGSEQFSLLQSTSKSRTRKQSPLSFECCSAEDVSFMVSPLVLSCESSTSNSQSSTGDLFHVHADKPNGYLQNDSKLNSQTRVQNSMVLDSSLNRTALLLVSLLNMEQNDLSDYLSGSSYHLNMKTESINKNAHAEKSGKSCDMSGELNSLNERTNFTEQISQYENSESETSQWSVALAYFKDECIGNSESFCYATESETQKLACMISENSDSQLMNTQPADFSSSGNLDNLFTNLSLESCGKRQKGGGESTDSFKEEVSSHGDTPCNDFCHSDSFRDQVATGYDFFQEQNKQIDFSFTFLEDIDALMSNLELSNFSFSNYYKNLQELQHAIDKAPLVTSPEEYVSQCKGSSKENEQKNDSQILCGKQACEYSESEESFYGTELSDSLLQEACATNSGVEINEATEKETWYASMKKQTVDGSFAVFGACAPNSVGVEVANEEKQTVHYHGSKIIKIPERTTTERGTGIITQNCEVFEGDDDNAPCQDKPAVNCTSRCLSLGTPTQLSFQSLFDSSFPNQDEHVSTPVLFDDTHDSRSNSSHSKLYRSLSLPETPHSTYLMERQIAMNNHSTPMYNECERKFTDLSEDFQNYSGSRAFSGDFEKQQLLLETTVSLRAQAPDQDGINCAESVLHVPKRQSLGNKELTDVHGGPYAFSPPKRIHASLKLEHREKYSTDSISVGSRTPGEGQKGWHGDDQVCPDTPLLFSFSSIGSTSREMTPDILQDSLLCASLLECSYLK